MKDERNALVEVIFFSLILALLIGGTWYGLRKYIMLVSFYTSFYAFKVYEYLPILMTSSEYNSLLAARKAIPTLRPADYGIWALLDLFKYHGYVWRAVVIPTMLWWGWSTKAKIVRFRYNREIRNVYELIEIQAEHFPASAIIRGKDLLSLHPYEGPWATYALPLDFALDHGIIWTSKNVVSLQEPVNQKTMFPIPAFTRDEKLETFPVKRTKMPHHRYAAFHVDRANDLFAKQLGPLWEGVEKLPPLEKALFAALCAQAAGKPAECWKMVEQLAFSWKEAIRDKEGKLISHHTANTQGTKELLDKYLTTPAVLRATQVHAYTNNVFTAVLKACRAKGRLMHANFLWLKPVNRTLWYALCGQGGQTPYWEAAGAFAHGLIEEGQGSKIVTPMVAGAVYALRDTMSREHWIDPGDYSEEAQKQVVREANDLLNAELEKSKKQGGKQPSPSDLYNMNKPIIPPKKMIENEED